MSAVMSLAAVGEGCAVAGPVASGRLLCPMRTGADRVRIRHRLGLDRDAADLAMGQADIGQVAIAERVEFGPDAGALDPTEQCIAEEWY